MMNMMKRIISAAVCLVTVLLTALQIPTAWAADTVYEFEDLTPATMKFTESTESGYDFVTTTDAYDCCAYYIDMAYLLKDFDIDEYLKKYETGYIVMKNENFDAQVHFSTDGGKQYGPKIPREEVIGKDRYDDDRIAKYYHAEICEFSRDDKTAYEELCTFGSTTIFVDVTKGPVVLELFVTSNEYYYIYDKDLAYSKTIKITGDYILNAIKSIDIYDFDFTGKHNATLDTDAKSNMGNVVSIKYLDENKKNARSTLVAGDKGYIEFSIAMLQHCYYVDYKGESHTITYDWEKSKAHWDTTVQSHLKGGSYSGVETDSSSFITYEDNKYLIKLYHAYEIPEDTKYVIKQGTINITAPEDGAKPDASVSLSNIKSIVIKRRSYPQFSAGNATWFTINSRGKLEAAKTFSAGTTYLALVKLKPYGNFYFDETSVKNLQVPGASKFTIAYMRAGIDDYVEEDGYYLAATFPKVVSKTFYLQVGYDKSEVTANKNDTTYLTATSSCDLTKATDVVIKWYYSADPSKDATGKLVSSVDAKLKYKLDTSAVGSGYYKCSISCKLDGKTAVVTYPDTEWVKVTVTEKPSDPLSLSAVGKQNVDITEAYQSVDFEVKPSNASGEVRYNWYCCDASGNITDKTPIGDGQAVIIYGVEGKTGEKFYYKCVATDSKNTASLVFSCTIKYKTADTDVSDTDTNTPDTSTPDTSTPDTSTPDIVDPDTSKNDSADPDTSKTDSADPDTSTPDTSKTDSADPDASEPASSDPDTSKPEQSNQFGNNDTEGAMPVWLIIIIIVVILALIAAVVIIIIKKKKQ